jgi:hypothetical protein
VEVRESWLPKGFEFLSGLPERLRQGRLIVTMQAWFDDSGSKSVGRFMVIAGLFGNAKLFADISDKWDMYLRASHPGQIQYFKMHDACGLTGAFNFWGEENRDLKVRQMASVIDRDDLVVMSVRLDLQAYEAVSAAWAHVKQKKGDPVKHHSLAEPYMFLYQGVLSMAVTEAVRRGETRPIEICFDDQDMLRQSILASYPEWREIERDDPKRYAVMPVQPWFRDDKEWVMLQAADLIAGDMRLGTLPDAERPKFCDGLFKKLRMSGMCMDIGADKMLEVHQHVTESQRQREANDD